MPLFTDIYEPVHDAGTEHSETILFLLEDQREEHFVWKQGEIPSKIATLS